MLSPWVQPWVRGRSAGSFPEQRLVIEPILSVVSEKLEETLVSETNASHAVSSCLLILRYQSPEANLLTVICRPFHEELAYYPDKVTCSKLRYAFEQRVPDVDSKSLVFVCDDVCSTAIHLNHGIILSLQTNVRNALNRMRSRIQCCQ